MEAAPRRTPFFRPGTVILGVALVGVVGAVWGFYDSRARERERAEAEFARRTTIRHTLTREVLGRYEDSLFGLAALFAIDRSVSLTEFGRAARRIDQRHPGAKAFEWVPLVAKENRAALEADLRHGYRPRPFEFTELDAAGHLVRAPVRETYYPIAYIEPLAGNESALGYDLKTGPTAAELDQARATRTMTLTHQVRLVQEQGSELGVILIWPVYRAVTGGPSSAGDGFAGFVQGVFQTTALLERTRTDHPDTILDMLFVDASETDPARRVLYYRPSGDQTPRLPRPTEAEFHRGVTRELSIPMGGRNWHVLYRPRAGWIEEQFTPLPWVRAGGVLAIAVLLVGMISLLGRRTAVIERVVAERTTELAESRRELDNLLHALPGMAYRCRYDDRLTVLYVSEGALELTGHPPADFIGGAVQFRELLHPDDIERVRAKTREALAARRDVELEYRLRQRDGREKWVLSRGRGLYTDDGRLDLFEGLVIDITAQKNAEAARLGLERKLLEGQKLESLGVLAGGVAHDFNNLLTSILGNAGLVRLTAPPELHPRLKEIESATQRAAELARQMLAYAGKGRFVIGPVDLSALVEGMLPLVKSSLGRSAALHLELARDLPAVQADATQLRQIVMNLVINSSDAIGGTVGRIDVSTGLMRAEAVWLAAAVAGADLPPGDYVFLEVRDTGCGMTPETVARIFDPFFTTKFTGRGLGLAAVLGIVRSHGGALRVDSTPGVGTNFRLLLPRSSEAPAPPPPATANVSATPFSGRVLVIDDEQSVRDTVAGMLAVKGLTPQIAIDGTAGLAAFRQDPNGYAGVLLDLLMPGLDGEATLLALRALRSNVRVLLMSGYQNGHIVGRLAGSGPLAFIQKPFTAEELDQKLRELLG